MLRAARLAVLLAIAGIPVFAGSSLYQGTFSEDSDVALLPFTITVDDTVGILSYGYAGGTAPGGITIPEGGFATAGFLFDSSGDEIATLSNSDCPPANLDSVTGSCADISYSGFLSMGTYTLALTVYDNSPNGNLGDGFAQDGNPGFTCAEAGISGSFCDLTAALPVSRNGDYAVSITADSLVTTPEPSTFLLIIGAGALFGFRRLKARSIPRQL